MKTKKKRSQIKPQLQNETSWQLFAMATIYYICSQGNQRLNSHSREFLREMITLALTPRILHWKIVHSYGTCSFFLTNTITILTYCREISQTWTRKNSLRSCPSKLESSVLLEINTGLVYFFPILISTFIVYLYVSITYTFNYVNSTFNCK